MRKVICILSDALRYDYIHKHNLKFLKEIIKDGDCFYVEKVIPSTGYCEIIEFITGKEIEKHKMFTQITVKDDWNNFNNSNLLNLLNLIHRNIPLKKNKKLKKVYQLLIDEILSLTNLPKEILNVRYNIPLHLLPFLEPIESRFNYNGFDFGGIDNLFVWMRKNDISYDIADFVKNNKIRGSDEDRLERLKNKITQKKLKNFTLLYIGYGELAHSLGTNSERFRTVLQSYSEQIRRIFYLINKRYPSFQIIILGDHGMIDVVDYVDVNSVVNRIFGNLNLRCLQNYIYFIDSTLIRIWLRQKELVQVVENKLIEALADYIEYDSNTRDYLNKFKPRYGDIILLLKAGYIFFPDFFNVTKNKGMHGYLNKYKEQAGTMISFGTGVKPAFKESIKLSDVKSYIQEIWMN